MLTEIQIQRSESSRINDVDFNNIPFGREFTDHMFEANYRDGRWCDFQIKPLQRLSIHPAMMTLHYGQAIFEGMKAFKNKDGLAVVFRPEDHARRFNLSAHRLCMPEIDEEIFVDAINQLVSLESDWIPTQPGSAMYLRPVMFATDEYVGVAPSATYKMIIFCLPVGPYYSTSVKLKVERHYIRAVHGGVGEAKAAGNYAASLYPAKLAKDEGYHQVLWLDAKEFKYTQEVGTMNIFFVLKDRVLTPATTGTILKGITRKSIIQLLKDRGIEVEERLVSIDEIKDAYRAGELVEVFGAGTAAVVANISLIADDDLSMTFDESHWTLSQSLKEEMNNIRMGYAPDPYGWVVPVENVALSDS